LSITDKTGKLTAIKGVTDNDDLMIITKNGITIRLPMSEIRLSGRATQGVKVINLRNGDAIAAVTNVAKSEEISGEQGDNNANGAPTV
jgi:DNA gyrase subunit A